MLATKKFSLANGLFKLLQHKRFSAGQPSFLGLTQFDLYIIILIPDVFNQTQGIEAVHRTPQT